jgi:hypothetical protein
MARILGQPGNDHVPLCPWSHLRSFASLILSINSLRYRRIHRLEQKYLYPVKVMERRTTMPNLPPQRWSFGALGRAGRYRNATIASVLRASCQAGQHSA